MKSDIIIIDLDKLKKEAEQRYPMPYGACAYTIMRVSWLRERWVEEQAK